jgi:hypothetical protein
MIQSRSRWQDNQSLGLGDLNLRVEQGDKMKKLIVLAILLFAVVAYGQTWQTANQVTMGWDAVAPITAGDTIKYQVYVKKGDTAPLVSAGGETLNTTFLVNFSIEGRYYLCVETVRYAQGETEPQRSDTIACSNVAADTANGTPFGVKYFVNPSKPGGLKVQ